MPDAVKELLKTLLLAGAIPVLVFASDCPPSNGPGRLTLGVSASARPYIFPETDSGIEIDVVRQALAEVDYRMCVAYLPAARAAHNFAQGRLDALLNVRTHESGGHLSDVVIELQNCAFALADRVENLNSMSDLVGRSVAAFPRAAALLEPEFARLVPKMTRYHEVTDQELQVNMLFRERVDVIVLDQQIFRYYRREMQRLADAGSGPVLPWHALERPVRTRCFFEPSAYRIEFAEREARDAFNLGLQQLRDSGRYDAIVESYLPSGR